jgi:O-antigen/teichoic acid export membrane protein
VGVVAAAALAGAGVTAVLAWAAVFALAPLASLLVAVVPARGDGAATVTETVVDGAASTTTPGQFGWSAALLFTGQALWNLGPVIVVYRLSEAPMIAAGFAAFAVVLRVPILLFPALQAILLPPITAMFSRGERRGVSHLFNRLWVWLGVLGVGWMAGTVLLAEPVVELLFSAVGAVPSRAIIAVLALSALAGAGAQLLQIGLIAQRRQRAVALSWSVGLVVFVVTAFAPIDPVVAAAFGQLAGAVVAVALLGIGLYNRVESRSA